MPRYKRFKYYSVTDTWMTEDGREAFCIERQPSDSAYQVQHQMRGEAIRFVSPPLSYRAALAEMHKLLAAADEKGG